MTEKSSRQEEEQGPITMTTTAVNEKILNSMQESISALPPTPKFLRKKSPSSSPDNMEEEKDGTESSEIEYPIRQLAKLPSFKRTAALLRKYPSLTMVRQMSSCEFGLSNDSMFIPEENEVPAVEEEQHNRVSNDDASDSESSTWSEMEIEVCKGVNKRLRGSDETFEAFQRGECIETACLMCSVHLLCIADCEGVICPLCLSMSPIESLNSSSGSGTVGLGIQYAKADSL